MVIRNLYSLYMIKYSIGETTLNKLGARTLGARSGGSKNVTYIFYLCCLFSVCNIHILFMLFVLCM